MYATPATGSSQNSNELEDYLLGKKRVDKILVGTENEKVRTISKMSFIGSCTHIQSHYVGRGCPQELYCNTIREYGQGYCFQDTRGPSLCYQTTGAGRIPGSDV